MWRKPRFPAYVRPATVDTVRPLDVAWSATKHNYLMVCAGPGIGGYQEWLTIEWQGSDDTDALESFQRWLCQPWCVISHNLLHEPAPLGYHFRPEATITQWDIVRCGPDADVPIPRTPPEETSGRWAAG